MLQSDLFRFSVIRLNFLVCRFVFLLKENNTVTNASRSGEQREAILCNTIDLPL